MTLYYTIVFLILLLEILYFFLLMLPLPTEWRKQLFRFISRSPIMGHVKYTLKIVFAFILVLFIDSVNRLKTIDATLLQMGNEENVNSLAGAQAMHDARTDSSYSARKFYAQRNMYLTGSTLFLTLIIRHTYNMTVELVALQEERQQLEDTVSRVPERVNESSETKPKISTPKEKPSDILKKRHVD
ncbi:B-cell receptor-associated protein 31-like-domain-containing protein [Zychaea mexicana]|uniref:B-cell receptor-associated protein 31-like-domain-containing protein n=1 Tax=Zychaea mexicana TaxID=64656 RepID=UPI0022FE95E4|nr:B-cell receptor-associated protein 31-like-domain-containing protein [Zychaea mexicana]KAI9498085.1 B-cell receptor-associated protein 31-like-domain-containing protein [Zychaea mexicana]